MLVRGGEAAALTERKRPHMTQSTEILSATSAQGVPQLRGDFPLPLKSLLDAGVHFGHQTKRWNPKMKPFIYGARNGIHIIDLDQTARLFQRAFNFVQEICSKGGHILMIGTKRQAQEIVQEEAARSGSYYVVNRWLGGTLTNFRTIKQGLERMRQLERMRDDGTYLQLPKKEVSRLEKERERFEKYVGGLKTMGSLPQAVFIIDPARETIAGQEARKLQIPIIASTDTNCDPDVIDYAIPGNDDAIRSIKLITQRLADAVVEGTQRRKEFAGREDDQPRGGDRGDRRPQADVYQQRGPRRDGGGGGARGGRDSGGGSGPASTGSTGPSSGGTPTN